MQAFGKVKKITILVNDQEMTFSEEELTAILEKYLNTEASKKSAKAPGEADTPTEGKYFYVNPMAINQAVFHYERPDLLQEMTRKLILEAFEELRKYPVKYGKTFMTMIPEKTWEVLSTFEMEEMCRNLGGHMADWVEQALEWAQRIVNGETWASVCNDPDTAKWYRLITWKNGNKKIIGGASEKRNYSPASFYNRNKNCGTMIFDTVPAIVIYT